MKLSQLECFKSTLAHEKHDQFLFYADFTSDIEQRLRERCGLNGELDLKEHLGMFNPKLVQLQRPGKDAAHDFSVYFDDIDISENAFINSLGVLETPGSAFHFTHYTSPLRNAEKFEDLEAFPYPDAATYTDNNMAGDVQTAHGEGRVVTSWVGHMYESSWQIRGYEQFLMDMVIRPEWCEFILDKVKQRNLAIACAAARAGVDYIMTGDDVANQKSMMFAPEQWRKFMKPRWAEVYAAAREIKPDIQIWYHSDGSIEEIIPELIEIGVTILNPIQPECLDPVMVKKKYGDKLVLDGTIGTQTTMPFGTADEVKNVVKERIETLGDDGALILSPTHIIEPEVPLENIEAFIETAREGSVMSSRN